MVGVSTLSRRRLLWGGAALGALSLLPRRAHAAEERYLVVYWNEGGWDPAMVFDPHFESSSLARGAGTEPATAGAIAYGAASSRPSVSALMEAQSDRIAIVNGVAVGSISHAQCSQLMLTGSRAADAVDLPTRIAAATGGSLALPHLILSGPRYPGSSGAVIAPLSTLLTGTAAGSLPAEVDITDAREDAVRAFLDAQAAALGDDPVGADFRDSLARSARLREVAAQLQVSAGADEMVSGVAALSLGLSRCVMMRCTEPPFSSWDSHIDNDRQQDACYEHNFDRLAALLALLDEAEAPGGGSLSERTTVLVLSEMGRTPALNGAGGKDHWPYTSAVLLGAGVQAGTYGATDAALVGQPVDPTDGQAATSGIVLTAADLIAGLLASFDIDPAAALPEATPFTAPLLR